MCCTRLAGNIGPQKSPIFSPPGTIAQLCQAISSQLTELRHVSTIGKKVIKQQCLPPQVPTIWWTSALLAAEIVPLVWGTPANFNRFRVLEALLSAKLCRVEHRAPPIFGRAAITLGIGPHSSYIFISIIIQRFLSSLISCRWNNLRIIASQMHNLEFCCIV